MSSDNEGAQGAESTPAPTKTVRNLWPAILRGILGGVLGGVLGFFAFEWLLSHGYYALVLPGSLVGMGCGLASGRKVMALGVLSALGALVVGVLTDWNSLAAPNPSLIGHAATLIQPHRHLPGALILVAVAISFYFGMGRDRR
jgi:hypothetical protein